MTLAYTRDAAGTGDNLELELVMSAIAEEDFNFQGLFSLQGKSFQ